MLASIPSPGRSEILLGPFPLRAYAVFILVGVVAAVVIGERRWRSRGGEAGVVLDVATIAVPAGIVGARLYHVLTSPSAYFGEGGDPLDALKVWEGGLGIWGGIAAGAVASWVVLHRRGLSFATFADAVAPGVAVAQGIGRLGNWFNQELYGRATRLPWGLEIDPENRPAGSSAETYHPTFLYELVWNLLVAGALVAAERRWKLKNGQVAALYVTLYCVGRLWIELLRVDPATLVLGVRINVWTSVLVGTAGAAYLVAKRRRAT